MDEIKSRRYASGFAFFLFILAILSWPAWAGADDLYVDNGTTLAVPPSVSYDYEYIGYSTTGAVKQTAGSNTTYELDLGENYYPTWSSGAYYLSGSESTLTVSYIEAVGWFGAGAFTQTGGTNNVGGTLYVGAGSTSSGTYTFSGGSINAGTEMIGTAGTGTFTQNGGDNTTGGLMVGNGGGGSYIMDGGSLTSTGGETIGGLLGSGTFVQAGGTNTAASGGLNGGLFVGGVDSATGSFATYNLKGGDLIVTGGEIIGVMQAWSVVPAIGTMTNPIFYALPGSFVQAGGTNTVASGGLTIGDAFGASSYTLDGGSLTVTGGETIGYPVSSVYNINAYGSFTQAGGTNRIVSGGLSLTNGSSYILSGGSLTVAGGETVDASSTFTQSGGSNTVTGGIDMNGGTYALGGGALLADAISGNLDNKGGTFIPAVQTGVGINLTGDYTQSGGSVLQINMASGTSYGRLNAGGVATLNGGAIDPVLENGFVPSQNQVFSDVVQAQSGIFGTFGSVGNFTPTMVAEAEYMSDSVNLVAVRDYTNSGLSLTSNQRQIGNMLNSVSGATTGDLGTVLHDIDGLGTSGQVACAFQQISPDMAASLANLGFAASDAFREDLTQRITSLRYGAVDGGDTGLGGAKSPLLAMGPSGLSSLLADVGSDGQAHNFGGVGVYVDPLVSWGTQSSTSAESGYDFSLGGFAAGIDLRLTNDFLAGVSTGYAHTDAGLAANEGQVGNDTLPVTFYTAYTPPCPFYAFGAVGYAANSFDMNRQIDFGGIDRAALSSTTGNQFNAYGEAGYDLRAGRLVFSPVVDLFYSSLWIDGFSENGADALDLNVASQHADSFQACPGIKVATLIRNDRAVIAPQFYATYAHEFSNDSRGLDASLNGIGTPFTFQTQQLGRNFAVLGASLTMFSGKNFSVQLDSNAELGRDNYAAYTVDAGLRFHF
ncbi:MAG: autotransporter domain-containing protein [Deltaproteobacteria bacterium]|jgi:outer membrane autotransporter protein|nr:autotransporter domain-containing protein [Deltaproteobacteria bacterium]